MRIAAAILSLVFVGCQNPGISTGFAEPDNGQEAFIAIEAHSGRVLASQNANGRRPIGGLVKIATASVAFDWAEATGTSLSMPAVVPPQAFVAGGVNPMGLQPGDQIQLRDALYSMLLGTDTVAAQTVAYRIGLELAQRQGYGQPVDLFVQEMNRLAEALGMTGTKFVNAHGVEVSGNMNFSTASDMARLGTHAMRNSGLAFYVKQKSRRISFQRGGQQLSFKLNNTNPLLGKWEINGIKAVNDRMAGASMLASSDRKPLVQSLPGGKSRITPRRLVVVALRSPNLNGRVATLVGTGWQIYDQGLNTAVPQNMSLTQERVLVPVL